LRAFDGVGEKSVKVLADKGITTFQQLRDADPERLQLILSRNAPFGRKLVLAAKTMPQFSLSITSANEENVSTGVQVDLLIEVGIINEKPPCVVKKGSAALIVLTTSDGEFIE
jgi:ATP-dependent DNA helicase HFM1/MER3